MARTGTGTRRTRAKTTGPGAKAEAETTDAGEVSEQPDLNAEAVEDAQPTSAEPAPVEPALDAAAELPTPALETGEARETPTAPEPEATPDTSAEPPVAGLTEPTLPAPPAQPGRGGMAGLVLGGVIAASLGAAAVLALLPQGWQPADTSALEDRLAALEARDTPASTLGPLEDRLAALENAPAIQQPPEIPMVDLQPLEDRLSALEAADPAAGLAQRIAQLENDLVARVDAVIDDALADARTRQVAQVEAIEAAEQDLASATAQLEAQAALAELAAAAETGEPAPSALPPLAAVTDLPPALDAFTTGLPQLRSLQAGFADAARTALAEAPLDAGDSTGGRVLNFLRNQTGARSLAPREGNDTDAILSRAEAHVRAANLSAALAELDILPEGPAAAMADWRARAETRLNALAALAEVHTRLNNE